MKRSSSTPAKSKSLPAKRRVAAKPKAAPKAAKSTSLKASNNAAAPVARKLAPAPRKSPGLDPSRSKQSQLISLLSAATGASMAAMTALTGWQRHTVRGTISGSLRKRLGLNVQSCVEEGVRVYRIVEASAP